MSEERMKEGLEIKTQQPWEIQNLETHTIQIGSLFIGCNGKMPNAFYRFMQRVFFGFKYINEKME